MLMTATASRDVLRIMRRSFEGSTMIAFLKRYWRRIAVGLLFGWALLPLTELRDRDDWVPHPAWGTTGDHGDRVDAPSLVAGRIILRASRITASLSDS